jgi:hypothetical protein
MAVNNAIGHTYLWRDDNDADTPKNIIGPWGIYRTGADTATPVPGVAGPDPGTSHAQYRRYKRRRKGRI